MAKPPETRNLPHAPGCYLFKDSSGAIIYIGKAKDLKKRVSSYFLEKKQLDAKTRQLVQKIASLEFISTSNETEALILENNLIKRHQPHYNIDLKDSRRYAYIQVTNEEFPRVILARKREKEGSYFGPLTSASERDSVIFLIGKLFCLRTCRKLPKKPCLRYHLKLCDAPCIGNITPDEYGARIRKVKRALGGNTRSLIKELEQEMKSFSGKLEFERAQEIRTQILGLRALEEKQSVERARRYDEDILNYVIANGRTFLMLFNVRGGVLHNKQEFELEHSEEWLGEFIREFYSSGPNIIPKEIILPEMPDSFQALEEFLSSLRGSLVHFVLPEKGEKKALLEMVKKNIGLSLFRNARRLEALQEAVSLDALPEVIECFDISHLSGTLSVGSMVQFRNGEADKGNYRRFRIKSFEGNDDFRAIAEVVRRRYSRLLREGSDMPNLIVIDGGKGQLNSALGELKALGLSIPVISLAKEFEEIYAASSPEPLSLPGKNIGLQLLQAIRDEAHRFAISYNRLLRKKELEK